MKNLFLVFVLLGCGGIAEETVPRAAASEIEKPLTGCVRVKEKPSEICAFQDVEVGCATYEKGIACYVEEFDTCYYFGAEELSCEIL